MTTTFFWCLTTDIRMEHDATLHGRWNAEIFKKIITNINVMNWHGWDSFPSGLLPAVWQWVESVPAAQSTLCTAARTHCTTPLTLTTFRQTKSHSRLTTIKQHKTQTTHKHYISLYIEDSTSTQYDNYLLSLCCALFVTSKLLWLLGLTNSSRMERTESVQNLPQNPYDTTHLTLVMLLHYLGKLKIQIFCRCGRKCL